MQKTSVESALHLIIIIGMKAQDHSLADQRLYFEGHFQAYLMNFWKKADIRSHVNTWFQSDHLRRNITDLLSPYLCLIKFCLIGFIQGFEMIWKNDN